MSGEGTAGADLHGGVGLARDRGSEFTETIGVLVGVVSAEQQFATRGKDGADTSGSIAPIAAICSGQLRAGQRTGHDSSKLATIDVGCLGSGPPHRDGAVDLLCQTFRIQVLFPGMPIRGTIHASSR
jgi:hypothetical protein